MDEMARILIVDDVPENITMIKDSLKEKYDVMAATNGKKALELANKEQQPDLILLDIIMPNMDGFEVCKRLKSNENTKDIPVIFLTVVDQIECIIEGFNYGGVDYVTKPFEPAVLNARIETHITISDQKKQLIQYSENLQYLVTQEVLKKKKVARKLLAMFDQAHEGFAFVDSVDMTISDFNDKFALLLSLDKNSLDGKSINEVTNGIFQEMLNSIEDNKYVKEQIEFVSDSKKMILDTTVHKIISHDLEDSCIAISIDDITQKVELEDQLILQTKQAEMGDMIAMIAHQWKQPLTIISTISSGIKVNMDFNEEVYNEKTYNFMSQIEEQVMYMSDTIDDFRNYLKPETKPQITTVSSLITKVLSIIGKTLTTKEINIVTLFNNDFKLKIYINDMVQVMLNLLGNSKNAIINNNIQKGKIELTTEEDYENFYLKICDNGGGIDNSAIQKAGTKYFTTDKENGTGLGLYMSKKIIKKHLSTNLELHNSDEGLCVVIIFKKDSDYIIN